MNTYIPWNIKKRDGVQMFCLMGPEEDLLQACSWLTENATSSYDIGPINKDERGPHSMAVHFTSDRDAMLFKLTWAG